MCAHSCQAWVSRPLLAAAFCQVAGESTDEEAPAAATLSSPAGEGAGAGQQLQNGSCTPADDVEGEEQAGAGPGSVVLASLNRLRKVYGRHVAVHDLSLHLRMNEVTALLGHNGAGQILATQLPNDINNRPSALP